MLLSLFICFQSLAHLLIILAQSYLFFLDRSIIHVAQYFLAQSLILVAQSYHCLDPLFIFVAQHYEFYCLV
jgi:vancomycin permeability regulator SanA